MSQSDEIEIKIDRESFARFVSWIRNSAMIAALGAGVTGHVPQARQMVYGNELHEDQVSEAMQGIIMHYAKMVGDLEVKLQSCDPH